jgi:predicted nuclease of restriction endonuclease-like (RecB) superfamily
VQARHLVKDPYIIEFFGIPAQTRLTENKLETALINHLQGFLMELGKGFAFVARQQHIVTDTADFYIDLVFVRPVYPRTTEIVGQCRAAPAA